MLSVLMTTEGTYPYSAGGVSTWCDALLRNTPDVRWTLLPLMMNPHVEQKFDPPSNVRKTINVPLWGIEEPSEFSSDIPFGQLYDRKRRTSAEVIESEFLPVFRELLRVICADPADSPALGRVFVALEDYFRRHDYNETFKSRPVWLAFRKEVEEYARASMIRNARPGPEHQLPSIFDLTECLRWLYHFLIVLTVRIPKVSVTHSTAAAFCGIPCITARVRNGTPMILTEHGVYLRERYLGYSRAGYSWPVKALMLSFLRLLCGAGYRAADLITPGN
ncbi:MAG TPA: DUF3492 domain-containing protein, partial [Thermoanaerobaculia bacterium]|nr:DUF3492 domain-containing protein [Thermoanaerobaculia bacterium]